MPPYVTDPFSSSLPYDKLRSMYSPIVIEIVKPIYVNAGDALAWFEQYGGGTQYELPKIVAELIAEGVLKLIKCKKTKRRIL